MTRFATAAWLAILLLGACAVPSRPLPAQTASGKTCRLAPNDGPVLTERGIGGTGISPGPAAGEAATRLADRGIGGTGIIGTITGFASVCVNGLEVAYDAATPVQVDDSPARAEDLRAGELAVIEAGGTSPDLAARTIVVRHEVLGPVEAVEDDGARLKVAGQTVTLSPRTRGATVVRPGEWIAVSGSRDETGNIAATRIDAPSPGTVIVHGRLEMSGLVWRIGTLELRLTGQTDLPPPGRDVVAAGRYQSGVLVVSALAPDRLAADPAGYFGPGIARLVIETEVSVADGWIRLGTAARVKAPGFAPRAPGRAIIEMERRGGVFVPTDLTAPPGAGESPAGPAPAFGPAPLPSHAPGAGTRPFAPSPPFGPADGAGGAGGPAGGLGMGPAPFGGGGPRH